MIRKYSIFIVFFLSVIVVTPALSKTFSPAFNIESVRDVVTAVTDWQISNYAQMDQRRYWKSNGDLSWENGVFLSALAAWAEFDQNKSYISWYEDICKKNNYQLSTGVNSVYFADDLIVSLMYATLFEKYGDDKIIQPTIKRLKYIVNNPSNASLQKDSLNSHERWCWCDALYMAPPVFARFAQLTKDSALLDFMNNEFWHTYDFLYDKDENLFYRDSNYFGKKESNGNKIFWGRGNAWVVGGLAQIITYLPDDYPPREQYIHLFKQMMKRLIILQDQQGYWHASLLDPDSFPSPETSGTGFYTFALWWGINNGVLDKKTYMPYARKGWEALVAAVQKNGMLGWVQPVGQDPKTVIANMTEVYGPAAMMLAGKEIITYLEKQKLISWQPCMLPFSQWNSERIKEISLMLPEKPKGFGPNYKDRNAWGKILHELDVQRIFERVKLIVQTPMPKWDDEAYLEFSRNGSRLWGERMINRRKSRLFDLVWAECIENKGKYIDLIEETLIDLVGHRSWVLPAHDRELDNFYGRKFHVDLVAALFAQDLAQVLYMLDDKISNEVREVVVDSIYSRVFNPVKRSLENGDMNNTWIYRKDNWNSVCLNGVAGAALFLIPDKIERAYFAAMSEYYSQNSLHGFSNDGYCTEGIGYFNYGFLNYIVLREELFQQTHGGIDLFDNPKIPKIISYGVEFEIQNDIYPAFADCKIGTQVDPYIIWYCNRNMNMDLYTPVFKRPNGFSANVMSLFPNTTSKESILTPKEEKERALRKFFSDAGVLIARHKESEGTLSVALKGGNNGENHNHNDVGSFSIVKGKEMLIGDVGGPFHYAGDMWTEKRYDFKSLSSYGHPVPVLNNTLQLTGKCAQAKIIRTDFSDERDIFELDLSNAYKHNNLKKIIRKFAYERSRQGSLIIEDDFEFTTLGTFETALTIFGEWEQTEKNVLVVKGKNEAMLVKIIPPQGCNVKISAEKIQENGPLFTRISIKLDKKINGGIMKLVIT